MAKQTILTERGTGEVMYPHTLASLVQTADGGNVDEGLEKAKFALFIDMWENRCRFNGKDHYFGKYNRETGFFELNEITDITYEEALQIWVLSHHQQLPYDNTNTLCPLLFGGSGDTTYETYSKCRTYFPFMTGGGFGAGHLANLFAGNRIVETLNFVGGYGNSLANFPYLEGTFDGCVKLREILCRISFPVVDNNTFRNCSELEYVNIRPYIQNQVLNFQWSPKLSLESLNLMVTQAMFNQNHDPSHTKTLTIILHPAAYARVTDELFALAAEKNITIETTE